MFGFGSGRAAPQESTLPPKLEPKHLYEKRVARDKSRLRAYNQILGQIQTRIYHTSQLSGATNYVVYTVPPFILGVPLIDMQDCIVYLVTVLRQQGYVVRFTYPNLLYISWKHYEQEYNRLQNPIIQAMLPPENTTKKGKEGSRGTGSTTKAVTFATVPSRQGGPGGTAPPRSAMDYQPPDFFLQGVTRPAPAPLGNGVPSQPQAKQTNDVLAELWSFA